MPRAPPRRRLGAATPRQDPQRVGGKLHADRPRRPVADALDADAFAADVDGENVQGAVVFGRDDDAGDDVRAVAVDDPHALGTDRDDDPAAAVSGETTSSSAPD